MHAHVAPCMSPHAHNPCNRPYMQFLFILKPQAYQRCRTVFIVMNTFALIGYAAYPLMPPRLVNDCEVRSWLPNRVNIVCDVVLILIRMDRTSMAAALRPTHLWTLW